MGPGGGGRTADRAVDDEEQRREKTYIARYAPKVTPSRFPTERVERRRKNGEVFPLELTVTEWRDGEASFYTAVMRDISARERAEASLRESEERYSRIFAHSLELITLFDVRQDGVFTYNAINPAAEHLTGISSTDLIGRTPEEVLRPEVAERTLAALRRGLAAGAPIEVEGALRRPDGSVASLTHQLVPIRDGDGRITQMMAKSRDVTEAKRVAATLRESQEQFERLFQHSADALFVVLIQPDGSVVYEQINQAARALLGVGDSDMAGKRLEEVLPPEIAEAATAGYLRCAAERAVITAEDTFELGGFRRTFHANLVPIPTPKADHPSAGEFTGDHRPPESGGAAARVAEARSRGPTRRGYGPRLQQSPARGGRLCAPDAETVGGEGEAGQAAGEILKAAERGAQLVKQLLAFSRRRVQEPIPVLIAPALKETQALLTPLLGATHPVKIWIDEDAAARAVKVDPAELAQAVMNLATNARDAMPSGGTVQIDLELVQLDASAAGSMGLSSGPFVEIGVHDTGFGMDAATTARVFEPFFTTKEQGKGTGLGLSMVYGFAQRCGGAVSASSTPGAGSSFRLLLPISVREPEIHVAQGKPGGSSEARPSFSWRTTCSCCG
jgi:PAS domain S-box-containing protein